MFFVATDVNELFEKSFKIICNQNLKTRTHCSRKLREIKPWSWDLKKKKKKLVVGQFGIRQFGTGQFGTTIFFGYFHQKWHQKTLETFYLSNTFSPVKSNPFLHSYTVTPKFNICSIYCQKCFIMLKYIKWNVLFQIVGKTSSVNWAIFSGAKLSVFKFLVPYCPGAKLSGCKIVRF